ncbi:MAG: hypothetical protein OEZ57_08175 [Nitrospirota bacterium]|nr:hypothetical protein [Nitrospirota bacterium]
MVSVQCVLIITWVFLADSFSGDWYPQKAGTALIENQMGNVSFPNKRTSPLSFSAALCRVTRKTQCQSRPFSVEQVQEEKVFYESKLPYPLMRISFPQSKTEFLNIEIYVDRHHRNFQDEIIEIFDQSLLLQTWQEEVPIGMECFCDDRETLAYSFILGHSLGKRASTYLKNLAEYPPWIELSNYGKEYRSCQDNLGDCQDSSRLQAAFRFLAIRQSNSGCLLRLKVPGSSRNQRTLFNEHPTFLREIHVAGAKSLHLLRGRPKGF